jgi:hypothetical protein
MCNVGLGEQDYGRVRDEVGQSEGGDRLVRNDERRLLKT